MSNSTPLPQPPSNAPIIQSISTTSLASSSSSSTTSNATTSSTLTATSAVTVSTLPSTVSTAAALAAVTTGSSSSTSPSGPSSTDNLHNMLVPVVDYIAQLENKLKLLNEESKNLSIYLGRLEKHKAMREQMKGPSVPLPNQNERIRLGICAMASKAKSKPMREILNRLPSNQFEIVIFPEDMILNDPVDTWPICHCLIAFFSSGYPLEKVEEYVALRNCFTVNDLASQHDLKDRRKVYNRLKMFNVPVPNHLIVNRDPSFGPVNELKEGDDWIEVDGKKMYKPFVEKPVDADDHNIYIYYPASAGGGSKRLFRKTEDRASNFVPEVNRVRRDGSFVYEEFLPTEATDVKVYVVTEDYAHAEARKSPVVDGKVVRDENGIEVRFPVILSNYEKDIARAVVAAFGQRVCGFDLLRSNGTSYVCDVNGWSFVKRSLKYYNDTALLLTGLLRRAVGRYDPSVDPTVSATGKLFSEIEGLEDQESNNGNTDEKSTTTPANGDEQTPPAQEKGKLEPHESYIELRKKDSTLPTSGKSPHSTNQAFAKPPGYHEELRCVIAVFRHGDRTPKQKLKMHVTDPRFLEFFKDVSDPQKEIKLKSAKELGTLLTITRDLFEEVEREQSNRGADDSESERTEHLGKLLQLKTVLEMHGTFRGINRKVQLKPTKWRKVPASMDLRTYHHDRHKKSKRKEERRELKLKRDSSEHGSHRSSVGEIPIQIASPKSHENVHQTYGSSYLDFSSSESDSDDDDTTYDDEGGSVPMKTIVVEAMLILKWGGVLTREGRVHAEAVGKSFRERMYPGVDGFIRLHSTYRHDLKIYSSDEGRVQVTAASFVKGLLDLEGHLTPILTSLVRKNAEVNKLLDDSSLATKSLDFAKERIRSFFYNEADITKDMINEICPPGSSSIVQSLKQIHNFAKTMNELYTHIRGLVVQLKVLLQRMRSRTPSLSATLSSGIIKPPTTQILEKTTSATSDSAEQDTSSTVTAVAATMIARAQTPSVSTDQKAGAGSSDASQEEAIDTDEGASVVASLGINDLSKKMEDRGDGALTLGDMLLLSYSRWNKLEKDFFKKKNKTFDISKIPDIYDTAKYDVMHNPEMLKLRLGHLQKIFLLSRELANVVVPSEYGIDSSQKVEIGSLIAGRLISKIASDLLESSNPEPAEAMQGEQGSSTSTGTSIQPPYLNLQPSIVPNPMMNAYILPPTPTASATPSNMPNYTDDATTLMLPKQSSASVSSSSRPSVTSIDGTGGLIRHVASDDITDRIGSLQGSHIDENAPSTSPPTLAPLPSASASLSVEPLPPPVGNSSLKSYVSETIHRLDKTQAKLMGIKSYDRHVRTRLYFTSESHIHALLNCLRFGGEVKNAKGSKAELAIPTKAAMDAVGKVPEINYLSHIVFRLFEVTEYAGGPKVYKARVLVSNGVPVDMADTGGSVPKIIVGKNDQGSMSALESTDSSQKSLPSGSKTSLKNLPPAEDLIPLWGEIDLEDLIRLLESNVPDVLLERKVSQAVTEENTVPPSPVYSTMSNNSSSNAHAETPAIQLLQAVGPGVPISPSMEKIGSSTLKRRVSGERRNEDIQPKGDDGSRRRQVMLLGSSSKSLSSANIDHHKQQGDGQ